MTQDILIVATFTVLGSVFFAFVRERVGPYLVALTGMSVLLMIGAITTNDMLSVFSNSAPITIACMFVISAALDQTGVVDTIGRFILQLSSKSKYLGGFMMIVLVIFMSAFMNNTPVVLVLTPVTIALAEKLKDYPSKYLIPLSYISILGGTCTQIGTSTNILVNGVAQTYGQTPFGMFEITGAGLIMTAAGLVFMILTGRYLLPERVPPKDNILEDTPVKRFMAEAVVPADSPLIGQSINDIKFTKTQDYEIIDLVRRNIDIGMTETLDSEEVPSAFEGIFPFQEEEKIQPEIKQVVSFRDMKLEAGDRLVFKITKEEIIEIQQHAGIQFDTERAYFSESFPAHKERVVEGVIPPSSRFIGLRVKHLKLRRGYGCAAIALHREGRNITGDLSNFILREGDSLILKGTEDNLDHLFNGENILNASLMRHVELDLSKAPIAIATIIGVVSLSTMGVMPIAGLAMIGAVIVILSGCVTSERAYRTIDWRILLLIFGMLGMSIAMENTGAATLLVKYVVALVDGFGPLLLLATIYLLTSLLTEMITNNAAAILLTPVVIGLSTTLGYDPRPFIVAVMFGASASFATPIGYQTNTFVYAAGGYKFKDFLKIGLPMNILMLLVATAVIPIFWPF